MKEYYLEIYKNKRLNEDYYELQLKVSDFETCAPGQFVNLKVDDSGAVLLRRPFSICGFENGKLRIVYKVIGKGTKLLSQKKAGQQLRLLGPLGNGFPVKPGSVLLVGGGVGVPPLRFLGSRLGKKRDIISCLGFRSSKDIVLKEEFRLFSKELFIATDDGSYGVSGNVIDLLNSRQKVLPRTIYCCGPTPMMRAVKEWAKSKDVACYVSLEENMGCGYGVCLSCAVKSTAGGYVRVCKEGPVFAAQTVDF